jgi:hypothetical protein
MTGGVCIRNKKSGLVLDMSQNTVTLQHYNGSYGISTALWYEANKMGNKTKCDLND